MHDHGGEERGGGGARQRRALEVALLANGAFVVAEVVGGLAFGSLALLADAAHMASDVVGLGIALIAQRLLQRPASDRHSFGLQRAEVLAAFGNALLLVGTAGYVFFEASRRLAAPTDVQGGGLLVVATLGLAVNLGSALLLARSRDRSLNLRGAYLHLLADAAGSVGVMVAGVAVLATGADWVDPAVSVLIGLLVLWSAWGLLRDTVHVLLEGTPRGLDPTAVERALLDHPAVGSVHHLHLWNIASHTPAMSAHVVIVGEVDLHGAQARCGELKALLAARYGISHATLELECHVCDPAETRHQIVH